MLMGMTSQPPPPPPPPPPLTQLLCQTRPRRRRRGDTGHKLLPFTHRPAFGVFMICLLIGWDVPTTKRQYFPCKYASAGAEAVVGAAERGLWLCQVSWCWHFSEEKYHGYSHSSSPSSGANIYYDFKAATRANCSGRFSINF